MSLDLCALVRRDHEELDRALVMMVDPNTPTDDLEMLLDVFRLALAVHMTAETRVLGSLLAAAGVPAALRMVVAQVRDEHAMQHAGAEALTRVRAGSDAWYGRALELRVQVLDHAERADMLRWSIQDHIASGKARALAAEYATERMRVLARTSPIALAQAIHAPV